MAGRPQGAQARTEVLQVRFAPSGMEMLRRRAVSLGLSRSAYIRMLVKDDLAKEKQ